MTDLPAPHEPGRYGVAFICSGNICRSPSADVVLARMLDDAGVDGVTVASGGIGDWHVGDPMDRRSAAVLTARGYDASRHRARQVQPSWAQTYDVLLAMDHGHREALTRLVGRERVRLFGDFDPEHPGIEVPDPYYGDADGFEDVLDLVERTCRALLPPLRRAVSLPRS